MALNFKKPEPQAPVVMVAYTQYGQLACGICRREPPLAPGSVCRGCLTNPKPAKEKK